MPARPPEQKHSSNYAKRPRPEPNAQAFRGSAQIGSRNDSRVPFIMYTCVWVAALWQGATHEIYSVEGNPACNAVRPICFRGNRCSVEVTAEWDPLKRTAMLILLGLYRVSLNVNTNGFGVLDAPEMLLKSFILNSFEGYGHGVIDEGRRCRGSVESRQI